MLEYIMKPEYGIVNSALVHIISVVFINGSKIQKQHLIKLFINGVVQNVMNNILKNYLITIVFVVKN